MLETKKDNSMIMTLYSGDMSLKLSEATFSERTTYFESPIPPEEKRAILCYKIRTNPLSLYALIIVISVSLFVLCAICAKRKRNIESNLTGE